MGVRHLPGPGVWHLWNFSSKIVNLFCGHPWSKGRLAHQQIYFIFLEGAVNPKKVEKHWTLLFAAQKITSFFANQFFFFFYFLIRTQNYLSNKVFTDWGIISNFIEIRFLSCFRLSALKKLPCSFKFSRKSLSRKISAQKVFMKIEAVTSHRKALFYFTDKQLIFLFNIAYVYNLTLV